MTAPVFYAPEVQISGVSVPLLQVPVPCSGVVLVGDEGRHAARVQRIKSGERLDLVDGNGLRLICQASGPSDDGLAVIATEADRAPARTPELVLVQALAKGGRDEQAIETATELGVDRVVPWQADRSVVRWDPRKTPRAMDRWRKILLAAMKQSRRSVLPELEAPVTSKQLTSKIEEWVSAGDLVLICHEEASGPLSALLASEESPRRIVVVVGPEGGLDPEELQSFTAAGASAALLGPEVLRSSTAGPAALVAANLMLARW